MTFLIPFFSFWQKVQAVTSGTPMSGVKDEIYRNVRAVKDRCACLFSHVLACEKCKKGISRR